MRQISLTLCFRYLQHRKIVLLSIAAVAMSCALLIVTDSLFTGFIESIETSVGKHLGDIILEAPSGCVMTDYDTLIESLESADCIDSATSVLRSQGLLLAGPGKVRPVVAWGVQLQRRLNMTPLRQSLLFQKENPSDTISFGIPDDLQAVGGIVGIGVLASPDEKTDLYDMDALKAMLGRSMALTTGTVSSSFQEEATTRKQFSRKVVKFKLADVAMTGVYQFDDSFVLLPIESLSGILYPEQGPVASTIHIRLRPGTDDEVALAVVGGIWQNFAQDRFDWYSFVSIDSAKDMQKIQVAEYRKQMHVLLGIFGLISMGIIILVFCIFYLIVMTRRKDIGILKSCGTSSFSTAAIFILFGTVVGFLGAVLGVALGYAIIVNINPIERIISVVLGLNLWRASTYMFTQIPNTMHWGSLLWVICVVIAAAVGSLVPAVAAARVRPVETLQYE